MEQQGQQNPEKISDDPAGESRDAFATRRRHGQVVTPLFVLAFGLMALGYYLGLADEIDLEAGAQSQREVAEGKTLEMAPEAKRERATLRLAPFDEREYVLDMRQKSTRRFLRGESELLETEIRLEMTAEGREAADGEAIQIDRAYRAADVDVRSAGEPIGADVTSQVEALLAGVQIRTVVQPNGQSVDFEWQDVANPQVRRALLLVRDAHRFTTPRFRRDALNLGETWAYTLETSVENTERGLVVRGGVDVVNKLLAFEERDGRTLAVIEQEYDAKSQGTVSMSGGEDASFTLEGAGTGVIRFDVDAGVVYSADVDIDRVLAVEQGDGTIDQTSSVVIEFRPVE